jgi:hypothetical protein
MIPIIASSAAPFAPVPAKAIGWPDFSRNSKCFSPPTVAGGAAPEKKNTASNPINPYLTINNFLILLMSCMRYSDSRHKAYCKNPHSETRNLKAIGNLIQNGF